MNITDIDDKIIRRGRQNYLFDEYAKKSLSLEDFLKDIEAAFKIFKDKCTANTDPDKKIMFDKILQDVELAMQSLEKSILEKNSEKIAAGQETLLQEAKTPICDWLDSSQDAKKGGRNRFRSIRPQT